MAGDVDARRCEMRCHVMSCACCSEKRSAMNAELEQKSKFAMSKHAHLTYEQGASHVL